MGCVTAPANLQAPVTRSPPRGTDSTLTPDAFAAPGLHDDYPRDWATTAAEAVAPDVAVESDPTAGVSACRSRYET